jgi:hypothetical protein
MVFVQFCHTVYSIHVRILAVQNIHATKNLSSVAEPEQQKSHHLGGAGDATRYGSGSGYDQCEKRNQIDLIIFPKPIITKYVS